MKAWLLDTPNRRPPDFVIGSPDRPYLRRWWIIPRNTIFNIYLHEFLRDDDDRALHDHPWFNLSILLRGDYVEWRALRGTDRLRPRIRYVGAVIARSPWTSHRISLLRGRPCWTLFITGPRLRQWGFHCPRGWVHWKIFTDEQDSGQVGRGCGEKS